MRTCMRLRRKNPTQNRVQTNEATGSNLLNKIPLLGGPKQQKGLLAVKGSASKTSVESVEAAAMWHATMISMLHGSAPRISTLKLRLPAVRHRNDGAAVLGNGRIKRCSFSSQGFHRQLQLLVLVYALN